MKQRIKQMVTKKLTQTGSQASQKLSRSLCQEQIICDTYNSLTRECSGKPDTPLATQIIIDGVDVSECEYLENGMCNAERESDGYTGWECCDPECSNCYYKQLARKTQELEQYKATKQASYEALQKKCNGLELENRKIKADNAILFEKTVEARKEAADFIDKFQRKTQECKEREQDAENWAYKAGLAIGKASRCLNALEEIEAIALRQKERIEFLSHGYNNDPIMIDILDIIADLRTDETKCNPDSEQIEHTAAKTQMRNSGRVEQIQDSKAKGLENDR